MDCSFPQSSIRRQYTTIQFATLPTPCHLLPSTIIIAPVARMLYCIIPAPHSVTLVTVYLCGLFFQVVSKFLSAAQPRAKNCPAESRRFDSSYHVSSHSSSSCLCFQNNDKQPSQLSAQFAKHLVHDEATFHSILPEMSPYRSPGNYILLSLARPYGVLVVRCSIISTSTESSPCILCACLKPCGSFGSKAS